MKRIKVPIPDGKILKKEDNIIFGDINLFPFGHHPERGSLTLTADNLFFVQKKKELATFVIPVKDILNVRAEQGKFGQCLSLLYTDGGKEKKLEVRHRGHVGVDNLAALVREPYFKSWELLVEEMRRNVR